jgi:hypothetical protein
MNIETVQAFYLDRTVTLTEAEICERSGLTQAELRALVDAGAFAPADTTAWTYSFECLTAARTAFRLREEFALDDMHALAVVMRLTQRLADLQEELARVRARLAR